MLVPHDDSETSDRALRHAVYLSKMSVTEIVTLHVIDRTGNFLGRMNEKLALVDEWA
jgi:nucleotide-binding universal stress UspA family protein